MNWFSFLKPHDRQNSVVNHPRSSHQLLSTLTDGLFTYERIYNAPKPWVFAIRTWFHWKKILVCEDHFLYINVWIPLAKIHSLPFVIIRENLRSIFNLHSSFIALYAVEEDQSSFRATLRTETWLEDSIYNSDWTKTLAAASFEL